jgi:hypothetical protein
MQELAQSQFMFVISEIARKRLPTVEAVALHAYHGGILPKPEYQDDCPIVKAIMSCHSPGYTSDYEIPKLLGKLLAGWEWYEKNLCAHRGDFQTG